MTVELRVAQPTDLPAIARLSDQVFRAKRGGHMADEFPYLYDPANSLHWYIALDQSRVVSIVGAMLWPVVIAGAASWAASVGSVATAPPYRGQRLASQLLQLAQTQLVLEGARIMLISGDLPLYTRFGAQSIGWVDWYRLKGDQPSCGGDYQVRAIDPVADAPIIARLNQTHGTRFGRSLTQLRAMLAAQPITQVERGTKVALLVTTDDRPVSYLILNHRPFEGKSASRLVEWAGDPRGVVHGLATVPNWPDGGIEIPVTHDNSALLGALAGSDRVRSEPFPWLAKIIDGDGLAHDLRGVWAEVAHQPLSITGMGNDQYRVHLDHNTWSADAGVLTQWVFGHQTPNRPETLNELLPIPALWPEGLNYI